MSTLSGQKVANGSLVLLVGMVVSGGFPVASEAHFLVQDLRVHHRRQPSLPSAWTVMNLAWGGKELPPRQSTKMSRSGKTCVRK